MGSHHQADGLFNNRFHLKKWLCWLRDECSFKTEKFMVDCAITESEAIKAIFPKASIYYCHFHVGQIWERKMRDTCTVSGTRLLLR